MVEILTNHHNNERRRSTTPSNINNGAGGGGGGGGGGMLSTQSRARQPTTTTALFGQRDSSYGDSERPPRLFMRNELVPQPNLNNVTQMQLLFIEKQRLLRYAKQISHRTYCKKAFGLGTAPGSEPLFGLNGKKKIYSASPPLTVPYWYHFQLFLYKNNYFHTVEPAEIMQLIHLLQPHLSGQMYKMEKSQFKDFLGTYLGMSNDLGMDRLFREFDRDCDGFLNLNELLEGLSLMLLGTLEQRKVLGFLCNDRQKRGYFDRNDIAAALSGCLTRLLSEDRDAFGDEDYETDLIELTMRKLDVNNDARVSWSDWQQVMRREPLLMKCMCSFYPDTDRRLKFLHLLGPRFASYLYSDY